MCELFDPRWDWHPDPLVFANTFTIRPSKVKGWGMHERHEDRYFTQPRIVPLREACGKLVDWFRAEGSPAS